MVRLSRGYGALLAPYVDSKGNFGKVYSGIWPGPPAVTLRPGSTPICGEFFRDIDKDTVDFVDNYDGTVKALPSAHHLPKRAGERQSGHRRRHGLQYLRLQSGRGMRHRHCPYPQSQSRPDDHP